MRFPPMLVAALVVTGCATTYQPTDSPRVHEVLDNGAVRLMRDGTTYPANAEGLWEAVRGVPKAEEHAARYGMWKSFSLASLMLGSGLVAGASYAETHGSIGVGDSLAAAGISAALAGIAMWIVARPHYYDAINVYNDALDARAATPGDRSASYASR